VANIFTNQHRLLPGKLYDERKFEEINEMILGRKKISEQVQARERDLEGQPDRAALSFSFCDSSER